MWPSATGSMVVLDQFLDDDSPLRGLPYANAVTTPERSWGPAGTAATFTAFLAVPR